jgi:hypothetical protein
MDVGNMHLIKTLSMDIVRVVFSQTRSPLMMKILLAGYNLDYETIRELQAARPELRNLTRKRSLPPMPASAAIPACP